MARLALRAAVRTDTGLVRSANEDSVFASPRLAAVADGVGGRAAGEVASAAAIDQLILIDKCRLSDPVASTLERAVEAANSTVGFMAGACPEHEGMSTTLTVAAVDGDRAVLANVGDSRAYLWRAGELRQLTRDDSLVEELVSRGDLDRAAARTHPYRSVVTRVLDGGSDLEVSTFMEEIESGDRLLLCSDGLSDLVDADQIAAALGAGDREQAAERLLQLALAAGGRDNVSVIVADVVESEDPGDAWQPPI